MPDCKRLFIEFALGNHGRIAAHVDQATAASSTSFSSHRADIGRPYLPSFLD